MPPDDPLRLVLRLWALVLATFAIFAIWPGIDLAVTGLFHVPGRGFPVAGVIWVDGVRRAIWGASIVLVLGAVPAFALAVVTGAPVLRLWARDWGFVLALYALGPGLLVEILLKGMWGRARPSDVVAFGGSRRFTAPHEITDQCLRNCSLTAGEMAGAVALAVSVALVMARWQTVTGRRMRRAGLALVIALPVLAGLQRLAAGRHFLSDVILSALVVLLVATALSVLFRLRRAD